MAAVLADARHRADPFRRAQGRDKLHALLAALIDIDDAARGGEERIDAHDVVAHIVDQLVVARRRRAMERADQVRVIGGRIEGPQRAPKDAILAVFEDHGIPALPVVGRLDQGKGEIAQRALCRRSGC